MKTYLFAAIILIAHWLSLYPAMAHDNTLKLEVSDVTFYQSGDALLFGGLAHNEPYLKIMDRMANGELTARSPFYLKRHLYQGFATAVLVGPKSLTSNSESKGVGEFSADIFYDKNSEDNHKIRVVERPVLFGREGVYTIVGKEVIELIKTASIYRSVDSSEFRLLPHVFDINNDGLSDFIIPNFEHTSIWIQQFNGEFELQTLDYALPTKYFIDEFDRASLSIEVPKQIIQTQMIGNGHADLVVVFDDQVLVFEAIATGQYSKSAERSNNAGATPTEIQLPLALKADHSTGDDDATYKLLSGQDLNGDGVLDLIIDKRYFDDERNEEQALIVMFGALKQSQVFYDKTNGDEIKLGGEMLDYGFADFNGDGRKDLYYVSGEVGAGSVMSALFGGGFEVDIRVHLQREDMRFTTKPKAEKETQFLVDVKNVAFGTFLEIADINHDGKDDLLLKESERYLSVYLGNMKRVLDKKAQKIRMSLPDNPAKIKRLTLDNNHFVVSYNAIDRLVPINLDQ